MSIIGGSSIGVIQNYIPAEGVFLKNAWRFQSLLFITVFLLPFYYLYDRHYLKYERYRQYIRVLRKKGI